MDHLYKIYPKTDIAGIFPGSKRIQEPIIMHLNRREFIKCMKAGSVYAMVDGEEILIDTIDYNRAESLFNTNYVKSSDITSDEETVDEIESIKNNDTEHINKYQNNQINQSSSKRNGKRNRRNHN